MRERGKELKRLVHCLQGHHTLKGNTLYDVYVPAHQRVPPVVNHLKQVIKAEHNQVWSECCTSCHVTPRAISHVMDYRPPVGEHDPWQISMAWCCVKIHVLYQSPGEVQCVANCTYDSTGALM
jgi:hypothetical protein